MLRKTLRVWASSATSEVTDQDLDVNHPGGQGGNQKYEKGWIVEKEPHQWANFIYNNIDVSLKELLEAGSLNWDNTVNYKKDSFVIYNEELYRATEPNIGKIPSSLINWEVVPYQTASSYEAFLLMYQNTLATHKGKVGPTLNPHNDTASKVGTYTITETDAKIKVVQDDLDNHEAQANPHNLNAANVGCLNKVTGGHFTGTVVYGAGIKFGTQEYGIDNDGLYRPNDSFSIVSNVPYQKTSQQEIITDASYNRINIKHNFKFSVPGEDVKIMLVGNLSSMSEGDYTTSYGRPSVLNDTNRAGVAATAAIDEPAFGEMGLILTADTVFLFSGLMSGTTATMSYVLNNITVVKTVDVTSDNLIDYVGTYGQVRNIQIWFTPLSAEQESMLGG